MKYSDFFLYVIPEVPGCPEFVAERAIREAAIDFCMKTDLYIAEPEKLQIAANVSDYDLPAPTGAEPNHVLALLREGVKLEPKRYTDAFMLSAMATPAPPSYFAQRDNTSLMVGPKPKDSEQLDLLMSLKPSATSTSMPDTVGYENREVISAGALYRLQVMAGQPWTNGNAAGVNKAIYDRGIAAAMRQSHYGFSGASLTVQTREFI